MRQYNSKVFKICFFYWILFLILKIFWSREKNKCLPGVNIYMLKLNTGAELSKMYSDFCRRKIPLPARSMNRFYEYFPLG